MTDPVLEDTILLLAEVSELINLIPWVSNKAKSLRFSDLQIKEIQLAVEEIFVNIVMHAYKDKAPGEVLITVRADKGFFQIEIRDEGEAFDPTQSEGDTINEISVDLMDLKEGGLGLMFVRTFMDKISYEREGNKNIVTLSKLLISNPSAL